MIRRIDDLLREALASTEEDNEAPPPLQELDILNKRLVTVGEEPKQDLVAMAAVDLGADKPTTAATHDYAPNYAEYRISDQQRMDIEDMYQAGERAEIWEIIVEALREAIVTKKHFMQIAWEEMLREFEYRERSRRARESRIDHRFAQWLEETKQYFSIQIDSVLDEAMKDVARRMEGRRKPIEPLTKSRVYLSRLLRDITRKITTLLIRGKKEREQSSRQYLETHKTVMSLIEKLLDYKPGGYYVCSLPANFLEKLVLGLEDREISMKQLKAIVGDANRSVPMRIESATIDTAAHLIAEYEYSGWKKDDFEMLIYLLKQANH